MPGSGTTLDPAGPFSALNSRLSKSAVICGKILYPTIGNEEKKEGLLIFAQADLTGDLPYDLLEFTQDDPGFPNDGTADQWFDCNRFDAYKRLGSYLGERAVSMVDEIRNAPKSGSGGTTEEPPVTGTPAAPSRAPAGSHPEDRAPAMAGTATPSTGGGRGSLEPARGGRSTWTTRGAFSRSPANSVPTTGVQRPSWAATP